MANTKQQNVQYKALAGLTPAEIEATDKKVASAFEKLVKAELKDARKRKGLDNDKKVVKHSPA